MRGEEYPVKPKLPTHQLTDLVDFVRLNQPVFVLGGAGCSTRSGLADYRDQQGQWKRQQPITGSTFVNNEASRKRYWARSAAGWTMFAAAQPNQAHKALARLQRGGYLSRLGTQKVDGLHQKAGHEQVIDLHGRLATVSCRQCGTAQPRDEFQQQLLGLNPQLAQTAQRYAPDGDADLPDGIEENVRVPSCDCGGILKPDVVFFGENVPKPVVADAMQSLGNSGSMLVAGSSLMVYSGYRFCKRADELGIPIASVNLGVTRADHLLSVNVQADCGGTLAGLADQLVPIS